MLLKTLMRAMMQMEEPKIRIDVVQDGQSISAKLIQRYGLKGRDIRQSYDEENERSISTCGFVGFVRRGDRLLISIPKHYMRLADFKRLSQECQLSHARMIMQTITKFYRSPEFSEYRNKDDVESDFALEAFYRIYDYFSAYGLYKERRRLVHEGYQGRISWKDTIRRSNKLIGGGNLIFAPFYISKNQELETMITQCMVFAINYTKQLFDDLIPLPDNSRIAIRGVDQNILNNVQAVVGQLYQIQSTIFKDIDKELVSNLIVFFEQVNDMTKDTRSFKDHSYSSLWETAVRRYLELHFVGIDEEHDEVLYDRSQTFHHDFSKLTEFGYDQKHKRRALAPDLYHLDRKNDCQYIFDAKYYSSLNDLNHKQLVYHFLFANRADKTYDALIMPYEGKTRTQIHVQITPAWLPDDSRYLNDVKIYLSQLNMIDVLDSFLNE